MTTKKELTIEEKLERIMECIYVYRDMDCDCVLMGKEEAITEIKKLFKEDTNDEK